MEEEVMRLEKKVDLDSGKVTYSQTLGEHTATCIASCEAEAKSKLGSDLLCALGMDGVISAVEALIKKDFIQKLADINDAAIRVEEDLKQQLVAERNKSWVDKLKASFWRR